VTHAGTQATVLRQLQVNLVLLHRASAQAASGYRLQRPADDIRSASRVAFLDQEMHDLDIRADVVDRVGGILSAADGAMSTITDALIRAREIALQSADGLALTDEWDALEAEVHHLRESVISAGNQDFMGRYLFGGYIDDTRPFDATGTFVGDPRDRTVELRPGEWVDPTLSASDWLAGQGGGVDVVDVLATLEAALQAEDGVAARDTLDALDLALIQVQAARVEVGTRVEKVDIARTALVLHQEALMSMRSKLEDADIAETAVQLARAQTVLQAGLSATGQISSLGLVRYLM